MTATEKAVRPEVLTILAALLKERIGVHYGSDTVELIRDRVLTRAFEAGYDSLLDYYYFLRYDPAADREIELLIDEVVVGETYFFRELDQLESLVDHIVAPLVRDRGRARIWSAACASGEEPLSLAMLLTERELIDRVDIMASDVSRKALAQAQGGRYGKRSIRRFEPELISRHISREGDAIVVDTALVRQIDWRRINLVEPEEVAAAGHFDIILCRNVLIYFDDDTVRQVTEALARQLNDGGTLVISVTESLVRLKTSLRCEQIGGAFFYRKEHP